MNWSFLLLLPPHCTVQEPRPRLIPAEAVEKSYWSNPPFALLLQQDTFGLHIISFVAAGYIPSPWNTKRPHPLMICKQQQQPLWILLVTTDRYCLVIWTVDLVTRRRSWQVGDNNSDTMSVGRLFASAQVYSCCCFLPHCNFYCLLNVIATIIIIIVTVGRWVVVACRRLVLLPVVVVGGEWEWEWAACRTFFN